MQEETAELIALSIPAQGFSFASVFQVNWRHIR